MFGSRGTWPSERPLETRTHRPRGLNFHLAVLARICGFLVLLTVARAAHANYSITEYAEDVCATESIYLDASNPNVQGMTESGIAYSVSQTNTSSLYSSRYIGFDPRSQSFTIRFDRALAAVGAQVTISGYESYASGPMTNDQPEGLFLTESGYRGVVANSASITELTVSTDNGPMSVLRVDIRPMPVAVNDTLSVYENSSKTYMSGTILDNDLYADGALLVEPPIHAAKFQLNDDGSFIYQPAKDYEGIDGFTYRGTNGLGAAVSAPARVDITVVHVNCAPEFVKGLDVSCVEDAGPQTVPQWATNAIAGPEEESSQNLTWQLTPDQPDLFLQQPAIANDGTLTYQPMPYQSGTATVTVCLHDDGGVANGGRDTSDPQTFTITIESRRHAPVIQPILDTAVRDGDALVVKAIATEMDQETAVTFSLDNAPDGASIDPLTGQIIWRPNDLDEGKMLIFTVRATAADDQSLTSTMAFHVEVLQQARPPQMLPVPDVTTDAGSIAMTRVSGQGNQMRYFLASEVPGASLNPITGEFHWTTQSTDAGRTVSFSVTAVDLSAPNLCTMKSFSVHVGQTMIAKHRTKNANQEVAKTFQTAGGAAMKFAPSKKHPKK